jgi:hypothetical protein
MALAELLISVRPAGASFKDSRARWIMTEPEKHKDRSRRRWELLSEHYYTEEEVALMMDIEVGTLRNRHSQGKNHPPKTPEGLYPKKEFHAWNTERLRYEISDPRKKRRA